MKKYFLAIMLSLTFVVMRAQRDSIELQQLQDLATAYSITIPDSSLFYGKRGLRLASEKGSEIWRVRFNIEISNTYRKQGSYDKAMEFGVTGLELARKIGNERLIALSLLSVGSVQNRLGFMESANKYYSEAIDLTRQIQDTALLAKSYMNLATGHLQQQLLDTAIATFDMAMQLFRKIGSAKGIASCSGNLGVAYYYKEDYLKSIEYGKITIDKMKELGNHKGVVQATYNVGANYRIVGQYDSARVYLQNCLREAREHGWLNDVMNAANALCFMEESLGNYKEALEYKRIEEQIEDSLFNDRTVQASLDLEEKYQAKQKDFVISELARKEAEASAASKQRAIWLIVTGGSLALLLVLVLLIVVRQRSKRREREAIFAKHRTELEHHALRARMNPHFLFNALSGIQHMYVNGKTDEASEFMGKFSLLLRKILEHTGRSEITLKEEVEALELYLEIEKKRLEGELNYQLDIEEDLDLAGIKVPPMVIQPFVENSIWHGIVPEGSGNVQVTLRQIDDHHLQCAIEDDGVGISNARTTEHDSKGMQLAGQRLAGEARISDREGGGTIVQIQIPIV